MLAGSQKAILCRDVLQAGPAFIAPSQKRSGAGRDGTGASLASSAEAFWLPFLLSGSACFSRLENILSQAEALTLNK